MAGSNGNDSGLNLGGNHLGVNLAYTKFLFILPRDGDLAAGNRLRQAGNIVGRGFFNDFDADGTRDVQPHETIQFFVAEEDGSPKSGITAARYALQVSGKYRPRLQDVQTELERRLGDTADLIAIDGADRVPRYTSAEMYAYAYKGAQPRRTGRLARRAFIVPVRKSAAWWAKPSLERHAYFYPHVDSTTGVLVKGHAQAAEAAIPVLYRKLYHNPDGYQRDHAFDFVVYFECEDEHVEVFERGWQAMRDPSQNPEWAFVEEGPVWRGRRVLRW